MKNCLFYISFCMLLGSTHSSMHAGAHGWLPDARTITRRAIEGAIFVVAVRITSALSDRLFPSRNVMQERPLTETEKKLALIQEQWTEKELEARQESLVNLHLQRKQEQIKRGTLEQGIKRYQLEADLNSLGAAESLGIVEPKEIAQLRTRVLESAAIFAHTIEQNIHAMHTHYAPQEGTL